MSRERTPDPFGRVVDWLLRVYPRGFRERFGAGMRYALHASHERARRRGVAAVVMSWIRTVVHAIALGLVERVREARKSVGPRGGSRRGVTGWRHAGREWTRELRHAARGLMRSYGFALAAIGTLGLGIGATTAVFSLVDGVILRPLPFAESDRLVTVRHTAPGVGSTDLDMTLGTYLLYRSRSRALEAAGMYRIMPVNVTGDGPPERVDMGWFTPSTFDVLRAQPLLGRLLRAEDGEPGAPPVAVLSHGFWSRRYGGDRGIVGRTIVLDGVGAEIVGVAERGFAFPTDGTEVWIARAIPSVPTFGSFSEHVIARLAPGYTAADAESELAALVPLIPEAYPQFSHEDIEASGLTPVVHPLKEYLVANVQRTLWVLLGTVGIVLLIACANVANLFLVRGETRLREVAVRGALGAGRGHLARLFLAESGLIAVLGGVAGILLAYAIVAALTAMDGTEVPRIGGVGVDLRALGLAMAVSTAAGLVFGAIPWLRSRAVEPGRALRESGRSEMVSRGRMRARSVLVVTQIALALLLLVGAGLIGQSYRRLQEVEPGFDARDVLTFQLALPNRTYQDVAAATRFHQQLLDAFAVLPGVEAAGVVSCLPLTGWCGGDPLIRRDAPAPAGEIPPIVARKPVSPGYFEALRVPLRAGRMFDRSDHEQRSAVVLIDEALARRFWAGESPIGRAISVGGSPGDRTPWYTIVGVVGTERVVDLASEPGGVVYFPALGASVIGGNNLYNMTVVIRGAGSTAARLDAITRVVRSIDPDVPLATVRSMEHVLADATARVAFTMLVLFAAALGALTLGAVGIYGVVSYITSRRTAEIGVRMALGASTRDVSRMVVGHGALLAGTGTVLGVAGSLALGRILESLLFGIGPADPLTIGGVCVLLLFVTLVASWLPARRAARVDPLQALRSQ